MMNDDSMIHDGRSDQLCHRLSCTPEYNRACGL